MTTTTAAERTPRTPRKARTGARVAGAVGVSLLVIAFAAWWGLTSYALGQVSAPGAGPVRCAGDPPGTTRPTIRPGRVCTTAAQVGNTGPWPVRIVGASQGGVVTGQVDLDRRLAPDRLSWVRVRSTTRSACFETGSFATQGYPVVTVRFLGRTREVTPEATFTMRGRGGC